MRFRRLAVVFGAVALAGTAACASQAEPEASKDEAAAQELAAARKHHFRSPANVVIEAARQHGDLTSDQEMTLDAIAVEVEGERETFRAMRKELRHSAVAVVRSGTADSEAFDQAVAEAVQAIEERAQRTIEALDEIHSILEPDQRVAVADALRARLDERFGPKPSRDKRYKSGFDRVASHLVLSTAQIDQLMAIKKELIGDKRELRPSRDELYALVDAFEGEDFGPALDAFHADKSRILHARIARAGERTDTVLSIFTPEQRELLADLILEGPEKVLLGDAADPELEP
jgi:Spy/CpxP family protein refolding chaperone